LMVGLDDLRGLFQPVILQFYDFESIGVKFTENHERCRMETACASCRVDIFTCDIRFWSTE